MTVPPTGLDSADIKLNKKQLEVVGWVVDEHGKPVKDGFVKWSDGYSNCNSSFKDGAYQMVIDFPPIDVKPCKGCLTIANSTRAKTELVDRQELVDGHETVLEPYQTLKIVVKTPEGSPLSGAKISRTTFYSGSSSPEWTVSDAKREIVIAKLVAGAVYGFDISCEGYYCPEQKLSVVGSSDWKDTIEVVMEKADRVQTGRVVDKLGHPVPGVTVSASFGPKAVTNDKGEFTLNNMPYDMVWITADDGKWTGHAKVGRDSEPVTIVTNTFFSWFIN